MADCFYLILLRWVSVLLCVDGFLSHFMPGGFYLMILKLCLSWMGFCLVFVGFLACSMVDGGRGSTLPVFVVNGFLLCFVLHGFLCCTCSMVDGGRGSTLPVFVVNGFLLCFVLHGFLCCTCSMVDG